MYVLSCLPVEQHSAELDKDDGEEEKDEDDTDGLQVEVLDCHNDLKKKKFESTCILIWGGP